MIVGRLIGMTLAVLVGVSATGCATTSMPRDATARPAGPTPVLVDPAQIYNDPLQGP
jgi:hypothetical protein